jgi:sec-independent protein translocase protein TatA
VTQLAFFDIGFGEMVVVAFVALLLFGGRLPEVMRTLGGSYRKFRAGMDEFKRQTTSVLDVRPSLPPYQPTPPASTPVATPVVAPAAASTAAPATASTADAPPARKSHQVPGEALDFAADANTSDDPPPV